MTEGSFLAGGWEVVLLFIQLCICVFHIVGGHLMVHQFGDKRSSSRFHAALRSRKPLTGDWQNPAWLWGERQWRATRRRCPSFDLSPLP